MLNEADHLRIEAAVKAAEARTTGEIVCILAGEVSNYRETPLAWAAAVALLGPPIAMLLGLRVDRLLPWLNDWSAGPGGLADALMSHRLEIYAVVQVVLFAITAGLVAIPPVRRVLTPPTLKRHRVHQAALRQFLATGLHNAPDRTGVVIFASQKDRRVELLADDAIHNAVGETVWNAAVKAVQDGMKGGDPSGGFVRAVELCGAALAEHFPASGPHQSLSPDGLQEI